MAPERNAALETPGTSPEIVKHRREDFVRLHILADARNDILAQLLGHFAEKGIIVYSTDLEFLAPHMRIGLDVALIPPGPAAKLIRELGATDGVRSAHWEEAAAINGTGLTSAPKI